MIISTNFPHLQKIKCPVDPYLGATIVAGTRLIAAVCAAIVLHKFKRRPVYLSSALGIALSLGFLTFLTYEKDHQSYIPEHIMQSTGY